jgi:ribosome-binding protein aMBF1 (putative translation factor)
MSKIEITDVYVLVAVERAMRHRPPGLPAGVTSTDVYKHAGVRVNSREGRLVYRQLVALDGSLLARRRRGGLTVWELTGAGRERVERLRSEGQLPVLPESPQHRRWRLARALARDRMQEFWLAVHELIEEAGELLDVPLPGPPSPDASSGPSSDVWFELAERFQHACKHLASACYCVWEWREPSDTTPDVDTGREASDDACDALERGHRRARRGGRRNPLTWEPYPKAVPMGRVIREAREQHAITPTQLAEKVEVGKTHLRSIEVGRDRPDYLLVGELAAAIGLKPQAIIARARQVEEQERSSK